MPLTETAWGIVVGGVGGTGVITIGQLLGMAAHLEGKGVVTQDAGGLAQKGGATWSHIQIANRPEAIHTTKVDTAKADLVIACDSIVGASKYTMTVMQHGRTFVALNNHGTPTAAFVKNPDWQFPGGNCEIAIAQSVGAELVGSFDAEQVATQLVGDSIYTNPLMMGYAWQKGRIPISHAALMRAIELNGVQPDNNKAAFEWGRRCAHDLGSVQALLQSAQVIQFVKKPSLDETVATRVEFLRGYQNDAYAALYKGFVDQVRAGRNQRRARQHPPERSRGALPVQVDGLQGRVRSGAAADRPGVPGQESRRNSKATTNSPTTSPPRCWPSAMRKATSSSNPSGPGCSPHSACWPN